MLIRILSSDWSIPIQVPSKLKKIGCISIPSMSVPVFWFKFLVWYTRSKNLNSRYLNGDLDAKLASCIPGLMWLPRVQHWLLQTIPLFITSVDLIWIQYATSSIILGHSDMSLKSITMSLKNYQVYISVKQPIRIEAVVQNRTPGTLKKNSVVSWLWYFFTVNPIIFG